MSVQRINFFAMQQICGPTDRDSARTRKESGFQFSHRDRKAAFAAIP